MQQTNEPAGFNPARPKEIGPDYGRGNFQSSTGSGASTQSSPGQGSSSGQGLGGQAISAGRDMAERAQSVASATTDAVRIQAAELASEGRDRIMAKAQDQKRAGAEYISGVAEAIRRAAREFDQEVPFAANYIRTAASGVDNVANTVRNGNFSELMTQTQDFARRQPTLFVGLSMLAGFGVARLLKGAGAPMMSGSLTSSPTYAGRASGAGSGDTDGSGTIGRGAADDGSARQAASGDNGLGM